MTPLPAATPPARPGDLYECLDEEGHYRAYDKIVIDEDGTWVPARQASVYVPLGSIVMYLGVSSASSGYEEGPVFLHGEQLGSTNWSWWRLHFVKV